MTNLLLKSGFCLGDEANNLFNYGLIWYSMFTEFSFSLSQAAVLGPKHGDPLPLQHHLLSGVCWKVPCQTQQLLLFDWVNTYTCEKKFFLVPSRVLNNNKHLTKILITLNHTTTQRL